MLMLLHKRVKTIKNTVEALAVKARFREEVEVKDCRDNGLTESTYLD